MCLLGSARSTASVGILIAGAMAFNYVITRENIPDSVADLLGVFELTPTTFLIAVNVLFLVLGCFLEAGALLLIVVPILIPTAHALGIDLVHFGVVSECGALMLGLITPPYGLLLFIVASITRQPLVPIIRELVPFISILIVALAIITFVPDFVLFLPRVCWAIVAEDQCSLERGGSAACARITDRRARSLPVRGAQAVVGDQPTPGPCGAGDLHHATRHNAHRVPVRRSPRGCGWSGWCRRRSAFRQKRVQFMAPSARRT
ncbi:MAG: TRAP transporter large permease subunit [Paracoccaceae bacterium]